MIEHKDLKDLTDDEVVELRSRYAQAENDIRSAALRVQSEWILRLQTKEYPELFGKVRSRSEPRRRLIPKEDEPPSMHDFLSSKYV